MCTYFCKIYHTSASNHIHIKITFFANISTICLTILIITHQQVSPMWFMSSVLSYSCSSLVKRSDNLATSACLLMSLLKWHPVHLVSLISLWMDLQLGSVFLQLNKHLTVTLNWAFTQMFWSGQWILRTDSKSLKWPRASRNQYTPCTTRDLIANKSSQYQINGSNMG